VNDADAVPTLDQDERELVREFVDVIVPASGPNPSASQAAVHTRWIDRGLLARPDLKAPLLELARDCHDGEPSAAIERLGHVDGATLDAVLELVIACYCMSPKARKQLAYRGQVATPILPGETEYYLRDDVLVPVSDRRPLWRGAGTEGNQTSTFSKDGGAA
jgi:hypothetical protein